MLRIVKIIYLLSVAIVVGSCAPPDAKGKSSRIEWGMLQGGGTANIIGLLPGDSLEFCSSDPADVAGAERATERWATAIGRWGHFQMNKCSSNSTVTINIAKFSSVGLNYWNSRPGRIFVNSGASGDFLNAILLHEVGHSFGLCDQYKDAASAGCSAHRSEQQQNSEIMGATSRSKLELGPGDIEGVNSVAADPEIDSTKTWIDFLKKSPTVNPGSDTGSLFVALTSSSSVEAVTLEISALKGQVVTLQAGMETIPVQLSRTVGLRDIYATVRPLASLSTTTPSVFSATAGNEKLVFKLSPKI